jgi:transposase
MKDASYESDLTDEQWNLIEPMLPKPASTGRPRSNLRLLLNTYLYVLRTGCQWRQLPKGFPPRSTANGVYVAWSRNGTLQAIQNRLRALAREAEDRRSRPTAAVLDSQTIRSAGYATEAGYDAAKKTKGRKRFLLVDTLGYVLGVKVTPANVTERDGGKQLLDITLPAHPWLRKIWADGGFSGEDFAAHAKSIRATAEVEVVERDPATKGFAVLAHRWVVERTFGWLVQCRRLARDYERLAESVEGWIHLAMIRIMLRQLA